MSSSGPGNIDSDTAWEYLQIFARSLLKQIRETVADPRLVEPDEFDSHAMIVNVEILGIVAKHIGRYRGIAPAGCLVELPDTEEIAQWEQVYLSAWERWMNAEDPANRHRAARKRVIRQTFQSVLALARTQHEK